MSDWRTRRFRDRAIRLGQTKCKYCGKHLAAEDVTVDHVVPLAKGGTSAVSNLAIACYPCNQKKGASSEMHFVNKVVFGLDAWLRATSLRKQRSRRQRRAARRMAGGMK